MKNLIEIDKYRRIERDIKNFCVLLNDELAALCNLSYIVGTPTEAVIKDICIFSHKEAKEYLKKQYEKDHPNIPLSLKMQHWADFEVKTEKLKTRINKFFIKVQTNRIPLGLRLEPDERLKFIKIVKGKAEADSEAIKQYCSIELENNEVIHRLEERARELHKELVSFDVILRNLTSGYLSLIGNPTDGKEYLINVYDNKIVLSLDRFRYLKDSQLEDLESDKMKKDDNLYIVLDNECM